MVGVDRKLQLSLVDDCVACHVAIAQPERVGDFMADDAVIEILKRIQSSIAAMDGKFTRQHAVLAQDVRLIRAGVQDMVRTRVTAGEVDVLHEDMSKLQLGLTEPTIRVEALEHARE